MVVIYFLIGVLNYAFGRSMGDIFGFGNDR
jgi:hypothetical protein